jgi:hypothetical protein
MIEFKKAFLRAQFARRLGIPWQISEGNQIQLASQSNIPLAIKLCLKRHPQELPSLALSG